MFGFSGGKDAVAQWFDVEFNRIYDWVKGRIRYWIQFSHFETSFKYEWDKRDKLMNEILLSDRLSDSHSFPQNCKWNEQYYFV